MLQLTPEQIRKLAGETLITETTIRRWAKGGKITLANSRSLENACEKLGIPFERASAA